MMRTPLLLPAAIGLLFAAGSAQADSHDSGKANYLARVGAAATTRVKARRAGGAGGLVLTGRLDPTGHLTAVRVVKSSGSLEADRGVARALNRLPAGAPPAGFAGAELTLQVNGPASLLARAP